MKASIHFELETPKDFEAFAAIFSGVAAKAAPADVVHAEAPAPEKQIAAPKADKPAKPVKAEKPVEEKPAEKPGEVVQEDGVEEVTKATVAKELRTFIQNKGDSGPKAALAVLKEFGASKFDELKSEDYSKFLTKLGQAA